ncbi:MAG: Holliday junction resolvase RuvX [Gaiellaceae bacterium]
MEGTNEKVLAVDYGQARTGLAVSDATGALARPLEVVHNRDADAVRARILEVAERERVCEIVVGMPLTLRGERGAQAQETDQFVAGLDTITSLPVTTFDERFTTKLAASTATRKTRNVRVSDDAAAAAHLLTYYLTWKNDRDA